jgi:hypothetical protein
MRYKEMNPFNYFAPSKKIKNLAVAMEKLHQDVCDEKKFLFSDEMERSTDFAEQFMSQFLKQEGSLYAEVKQLKEAGNVMAKSIMSFACDMRNTVDNEDIDKTALSTARTEDATKKTL